MAKPIPITSNGNNDTPCPLARLAAAAEEALTAYDEAEAMEWAGRMGTADPAWINHGELLSSQAFDRWRAIQEYGSHLRPTSPVGALFLLQLCTGVKNDVFANQLDKIEMRQAERSLDRMLYALRDYLEGMSDERVPERVREFWMSPALDPRDTVTARKAMLVALNAPSAA